MFAPYQDTVPEANRALSPPAPPRRSLSRSPDPRSLSSNGSPIDPYASSTLPPPSHFSGDHSSSGNQVSGSGDIENGRLSVNLFETSVPMRMDYEAMLAYLLLPPAGGVLLLVLEHKSDYVRFHAWQSSMLFAAIFVLHVILSWSKVLSWLLFVVDLGFIGFLALHAYRDAVTLDRFEAPFFGRLASSFVDEE